MYIKKVRGSAKQLMRKTAIWNLKGGVGKTTTVMQLALSLSGRGKAVLLIDMDPQANLSQFFLNEQRKESNYICMTDLFGKVDTEKVKRSIYKVSEHIEMIGSNLGLANAELNVRTNTMIPQLSILENILKIADKSYDYVFIDCPPTMNLLTINATLTADDVIIPVNVDEWAKEGFDYTNANIKEINENFGKNVRYKVLFTMVNRSKIDFEIMDSIKSGLAETDYYNATIRYQAKPIKDSKKKNISVVDYKSNVGNDYKEFVEEYLERR